MKLNFANQTILISATLMVFAGCGDDSIEDFQKAEENYWDARADYRVVSSSLIVIIQQYFELPPPVPWDEELSRVWRDWAERFDRAVTRLGEEFEKVEQAYWNVEIAGSKASDLWNGPDGLILRDDHQAFVERHVEYYAQCLAIHTQLREEGYLAQ